MVADFLITQKPLLSVLTRPLRPLSSYRKVDRPAAGCPSAFPQDPTAFTDSSSKAVTETLGFGPDTLAESVNKEINSAVLPASPDLAGRSVQGRWNPVHMAFLGDAVWELFVRNHFFSPPTKLQTYYDSVRSKVRAETQATFYEVLLSGPLLSNREKDIIRWGHNAKVIAPKRFNASGKHIDTYKRATALECLVRLPHLKPLIQPDMLS